MKPIKIFLLLSIQLVLLSSNIFSQQCPPSALRIQSPICDTPKNLNVSNIKCVTIQLNWQGNKQEQYIVAATGIDNAAKILFEIKQADYNCNENGNCTATINVKEGATLNWNVQAICNINGASIYSPKVEGKEMVIPYCQQNIASAKKDSINNEGIRVYPNPTTGYLNVGYYSKASGVVKLKVFDINGKSLFITSDRAIQGNNKYALDLHHLLPGTYLLELNNNGSISKASFVVVRK